MLMPSPATAVFTMTKMFSRDPSFVGVKLARMSGSRVNFPELITRSAAAIAESSCAGARVMPPAVGVPRKIGALRYMFARIASTTCLVTRPYSVPPWSGSAAREA
jgi:hypothetical protein